MNDTAGDGRLEAGAMIVATFQRHLSNLKSNYGPQFQSWAGLDDETIRTVGVVLVTFLFVVLTRSLFGASQEKARHDHKTTGALKRQRDKVKLLNCIGL